MMMTRRWFAKASLCAGIGYKTDMAAVAEDLLRISGEDGVTVDRKFKSHWTGRLPVRFFIVSNEIPKLPDGSAVLAKSWSRLFGQFFRFDEWSACRG